MATNKKEAFRQYLEAAGVLDTITKSKGRLVAMSESSQTCTQTCLSLQFLSACMRSLSDQKMQSSKPPSDILIFHWLFKVPRIGSDMCCHECSYIKGLLGGPTPAEFESFKQEKEDLKQQLEVTKKQLEELQVSVLARSGLQPSVCNPACQKVRKRAGAGSFW